MTIMVDAGYLNSAGEIKGGAAEMFFKHRDEIIFEKVQANTPESEDFDFLPREDFIRSRLEFPTFHRNWVDGILTSCLKILDFAGSVSSDYATPVLVQPPTPGPIYDPMFVFEHVSKTKPAAGLIKPSLSITSVIKYFATPATVGEAAAAVELGLKYPPPPEPVEGTRTTEFIAGLATITSAGKYNKRNPKDFIPLIPSDEFPDLNYGEGEQSELSIKSKQELLFTAVVEALDDLISLVLATPALYLFPISTGVNPAPPKPPTGQQLPGPGLLPIFNAAKLVLDKRLPDPTAAADNAVTNVVNFEALKRWLIKPLYLTTIGVLFGSHVEGFVGLMGNITPDAVLEFNKGFSDPKPEKLDIEEKAEIAAAESTAAQIVIADPNESERNNVPIKRYWQIPKPYKNKGRGYRNEFYLKLREIGSTFVSSSPVNSNADDNHKGLMFMFVLHHESGLDPGAANIGKDNNGNWLSATQPGGAKSDSMIWQCSSGTKNSYVSSIDDKLFNNAPVWDPDSNNLLEKGMDVMQQLEYYVEFLARNCAIIGGNLPHPKKSTDKNLVYEPGGGKSGPKGYYSGPDPHVLKSLGGSLNKYLLGSVNPNANGTNSKKVKNDNIRILIPTSIGGTATERRQNYKEYGPPYYYLQTPYDIYAFHMGLPQTGENLINSPNSNDADQKHIVSYSIASRSSTLFQNNEHIPRYMAACGMSSIDWDQVAVLGIKKYVNEIGEWTHNKTVLPLPLSGWNAANFDEFKKMQNLVAERRKNEQK